MPGRLVGLARITVLAARRGLIGFYNSADLTHAAAISYYALLSLFPFLLLALSALGSIAADEADRMAVLTFVLRYFPARLEFMTMQLDAFRETRVELGALGAFALVWASLGVFRAVTTAVNHAWGVEKGRSYLGHQLFSFLMLIAAGIILILALILVSAAQVVEASWFSGVLSRFPGLLVLRAFAVRHAATLLLIVVLALVYYFVPNVKVRFADVWIGAILTGLLWRTAGQGFAWYMADISGLTMVHGSIAAVVVFLLWVYLSSVILLYGAEFTAAFAALRREAPADA